MEAIAEISPNQPVILLDAPECTQAEYARRTGKTLAAVKKEVIDGRLPHHRRYEDDSSGRATVMINLVKIAVENLKREF